MNVNDSEVVESILVAASYSPAASAAEADVVLLNTCAIRDRAEARVRGRLAQLQLLRRERALQASSRPPLVVGVLGCMAERLKERLLEPAGGQLADLVVGPDAYRDLPRVIAAVQGTGATGADAMNVQLSADETYADITPVRRSGATSAFVSIMRGCNNMCAFCIVPFTRGRERSRPLDSILREVEGLAQQGVREVTLLGQNVNSYADASRADSGSAGNGGDSGHEWQQQHRHLRQQQQQRQHRQESAEHQQVLDSFSPYYAPGFSSVYRPKRDGTIRFAELLDAVAQADPEMRVRFTSPHPKDFSDEVLQVVAAHSNVCMQLHMPAQSGSSSVLQRMRRGYSREAYDALVARVRRTLPGVALSTDIITGFCGETDAEHAATLDLLESTCFDNAFLFAYSQRDKTAAARHLADDVDPAVKAARLAQAQQAFRAGRAPGLASEVGRVHLVLLEGPARRGGDALLSGRTCTMRRVLTPAVPLPASLGALRGAALAAGAGGAGFDTGRWAYGGPCVGVGAGDYVAVRVEALTGSGSTLLALPLARTSIHEFVGVFGGSVPLLNAAQIPWLVPTASAAALLTGVDGIGGVAAAPQATAAALPPQQHLHERAYA